MRHQTTSRQGVIRKVNSWCFTHKLRFTNTVHFGLRGCKEHRDMCRGYVKLWQAKNGEEFLEYSERQTKTRTVENPRDIRQIKQKMFAVPESERDLIAVYKLYAKTRPSEMSQDNAPFYVAVNTCKNHDYSKPWFKKSAVGLNKLNSLLKTMAEKTGLEPNVKNHSGRKIMIQTLTNNGIPATDIIQLSVWQIIQWSQKNNKLKCHVL